MEQEKLFGCIQKVISDCGIPQIDFIPSQIDHGTIGKTLSPRKPETEFKGTSNNRLIALSLIIFIICSSFKYKKNLNLRFYKQTPVVQITENDKLGNLTDIHDDLIIHKSG